jgi:hypothetical protein
MEQGPGVRFAVPANLAALQPVATREPPCSTGLAYLVAVPDVCLTSLLLVASSPGCDGRIRDLVRIR